MLARMYGGHLDVVAEVWKVFEGHSLVFVVPNNILHHELRWKRLRVCEVAGKVESGSAVVGCICDVKGIRTARSMQHMYLARDELI